MKMNEMYVKFCAILKRNPDESLHHNLIGKCMEANEKKNVKNENENVHKIVDDVG